MTDPHGPDWSGRLQRLARLLPSLDVGALVVSNPVNIRYLAGFAGSAGLLVVTPGGAVLVTDGRYDLAVREAMGAGRMARIDLSRVERRYDLTLSEVLRTFEGGRVGFEAAHLTVGTLTAWQRQTPAVSWIATDGVVERHRVVKDPWEIGTLREAGRRLAGIAESLDRIVLRDRTERTIAHAIEEALLAAGFSEPAFATIVASGPRSAHPHARPTDRPLAPGDLVVLDFGGVLDGYCVDLTRAAAVAPVSDEAHALYRAVRDAQAAAMAAVAPGIELCAIDQAARTRLEAAGLGEAFSHSTGHGLGLEVHEAPRIARRDPELSGTVESGMVFTIEPGAYVERLGGVRLEDDVLVTAEGCEVLTNASRDLLVV